MIECVPNISEGQDRRVIDAVLDAVAGVPGVRVLHVDIGEDPNRSVITMCGKQEPISEAAFTLIRLAAEKIDMRRHRGVHPRIGATDVCPFVPLDGASLSECLIAAERLAMRVGEELKIPVFLYEHSAKHSERKLLANIRRGQFEQLAAKMADPVWAPDYGPTAPHPTAGACVIGARELLVAFNINLSTSDIEIAKSIAAAIRETRGRTSAQGLAGVRAIGWHVPKLGCAQVSTNITDFRQVGLAEVFRRCEVLAKQYGVSILGSELIGLVPMQALLEAGKKLSLPEFDRDFSTLTLKDFGPIEVQMAERAADTLGLSHFNPFKAKERILELRLATK